MVRKTLRKSEIRSLNESIETNCSISDYFSKKDFVEADDLLVYKDKVPVFFLVDKVPVPTLRSLLNEVISLPKLVVDMGAIKFVTSGADIMRPGITKVPEGVAKGLFVVIVDENNSKPLAVGSLLFSSDEISAKTTGKVVKNLHYVGDAIWSN